MLKSIFKSFLFFLGPVILFIILKLPLNWKYQEQLGLALLASTIWQWTFTKVPLHITGIFTLILGHFLGLIPWDSSLKAFANPVIFLFMGGFFIAKAIEVHKLDRRLALMAISHPFCSRGPHYLFAIIIALTAIFSMWLSNVATTAIFLPIAVGILNEMKVPNKSKESATLLLISHSATIGGIGTPVGSAPNIITIAMIEKMTGTAISFSHWMFEMIPLMFLSLFALYLVFLPSLKKLPSTINSSEVKKELLAMGKFTFEQKIVLMALIGAITLWVTPGIVAVILGKENSFALLIDKFLPESLVSLLMGISLFIIPSSVEGAVLSWEDGTNIDWGTILLFGSGLAIGNMMFESGLANKFGTILSSFNAGPMTVLVITLLLTMILTEFTSNTATVNLLIPIILSMKIFGEKTIEVALTVSMMTSLSFMMPVGTPPSTMVFGTGKVRLKDMIFKGIQLNFINLILILIFFYFVF